jgi:hypothetical protein
VRDGHVCGDVNAKNKVGAFVGFKRFVVNTVDWKALIDPEVDYSDLLTAEELCSSMRSNSYSSWSGTESACSRAAEQRAVQLEQDEFNKTWSASCASSVRHPFRPPLNAEDANLAIDANESAALPTETSGAISADGDASDADTNPSQPADVNSETPADNSNAGEEENED